MDFAPKEYHQLLTILPTTPGITGQEDWEQLLRTAGVTPYLVSLLHLEGLNRDTAAGNIIDFLTKYGDDTLWQRFIDALILRFGQGSHDGLFLQSLREPLKGVEEKTTNSLSARETTRSDPIPAIVLPSSPVVTIGMTFISYARIDTPFIDSCDASLRRAGITTWVDRGRLEGGQTWLSEITAAIDACMTMLVVLSPEAVTSEYVESEYLYAHRQKKRIIPLEYRACAVPILLARLQSIDFRTVAYDQALQRLLRALQSQ